MGELERWLQDLGLGQHAEVLTANGVDVELLPCLTEQDLATLGLSLGHRRKLLHALRTRPPRAGHGAGERRQLTVLSCDLVGSTALAVRLDPEDMAAVMHAFQQSCATVVEGWGGRIAQVMGDRVVAYFGFPVASEHAAERAVRAGRELVTAVAGLTPRPEVVLAARVGIATGMVVVGEPIGNGAVFEPAAIGETPHLAARLQELAAAGTVVIGGRTPTLVGDLFHLFDLGGHRSKGMDRPLRVWQVLGERPIESRLDALRGGDPIAVVGRRREVEHLVEQFEAAARGEGRVVLLLGESGIGKSRILRALRERLGDRPLLRLRHYCSPFARDSTLYPVVRLLERAADIRPDQSPARQLDRLERSLAPATSDVARTASLFADLLGILTGDRYLPLPPDPHQRMQMTFAALLEQLTLHAADRTVLAVFEDVHWIDPSTRELMRRTVHAAAKLRVLVVVTARPEFVPIWGPLPHVSTLHLRRLSRGQSELLIGRMAGAKSLPPAVVARIVEHGDGVPLFIEELTKAILESDALKDCGTHYDLAGPSLPAAIPTTLQDSLAARLDHLGTAKEVAQIGAVIGREFSFRLLAAVAALDRRVLEAALDRLVQAGIMMRHGNRADAHYGFRHALIQEAAYDSLLKCRRRELHARVVEVLATQFDDLVAQRPEALAHHAAQAGFVEQAIVHWQRAGSRALARSAAAEAIEHLRHALAQVRALPEGHDRTARELEIHLALGGALVAREGHPAPLTGLAYDRARELCARLEPTPQLYPVLWGQSVHHCLRADLDQALAIAREFHRRAIGDGNPAALQVAERLIGSSQFWLGRPRAARPHVERALELYDGDAHGELALRYAADPRVVACCHLSIILFVLGHVDRARAESRRAIAEAIRLKQAYGHVHAMMFACILALLRRNPAAVERIAGTLGDLAAEHDYRYFAAIAQMARGWVLAARAALDDGIALLVRGLGAYRATGARLLLPLFLALLAEAQQRAGQSAEARHHAYRALEQVERTGEQWIEAEVHRLIANLILAGFDRGQPSAEPHLCKAIEIARAQGARMWELRAAVELARLQRRQGRSEPPVDLLAPLLSWFGARGDLAELDQARALLGIDVARSAPPSH